MLLLFSNGWKSKFESGSLCYFNENSIEYDTDTHWDCKQIVITHLLSLHIGVVLRQQKPSSLVVTKYGGSKRDGNYGW